MIILRSKLKCMKLTFDASMCTTLYVSALAGATGTAVTTLIQQHHTPVKAAATDNN